MKISRTNLENNIKVALKFINGKRKLSDKIKTRFKEKGFLEGEASSIISGIMLSQVSDEILWMLTVFIFEEVEDDFVKSNLNPEDVLTNIEIEKVKTIEMKRENQIYPLTIENVHKDAEDDFSTILSIQMNAEYFDKLIFKYNHQTQRPLISKWYGGTEVKEIDLNKATKEQISKNIQNGVQIPDEITINLLLNGEESFEFEEKFNRLVIYSGNLDVIDGWHRIVSARDAYSKNPNASFYYKMRIVHWDIDKAKAFIGQKAKGNRIDPLALKTYDVYNPANQIVNRLNENPKSILRGKITSDKKEDDKILFGILFDGIKLLFKVKENEEIFSVSNYLKDGFNLIAENNLDWFKTKQDDRFWICLLGILARYYKEDNWQELVLNSIEKIKANDLLQIPYKSVNQAFINKINDYIGGILNV